MKKSIHKPRKSIYYLVLAIALMSFGSAVLCLAIIEENKEYAEEASDYDNLAQEIQQTQNSPWFPLDTGAEDSNTRAETTLNNLETKHSDNDDKPEYDQTHPPDNTLEQEEIIKAGNETASSPTTKSEQATPSITTNSDVKGARQPSQQESNPEIKQENIPAPTPTLVPFNGYTGADLMACAAKNPDFVAWLKIPGTNVNYPVVLSDNTAFYLTHSFDGKKSKLGTLFSLGKTDYKTPGHNISIYGHHITNTSNGQLMFRPLLSYKNHSFYEKHDTIYMDSLYHASVYKIFAVINLVNGEWDVSTASFASDVDFMSFVRQAQTRSLYDTGIEVNADDKILTLITCDRSYAAAEGRLIIMAVEQ